MFLPRRHVQDFRDYRVDSRGSPGLARGTAMTCGWSPKLPQLLILLSLARSAGRRCGRPGGAPSSAHRLISQKDISRRPGARTPAPAGERPDRRSVPAPGRAPGCGTRIRSRTRRASRRRVRRETTTPNSKRWNGPSRSTMRILRRSRSRVSRVAKRSRIDPSPTSISAIRVSTPAGPTARWRIRAARQKGTNFG